TSSAVKRRKLTWCVHTTGIPSCQRRFYRGQLHGVQGHETNLCSLFAPFYANYKRQNQICCSDSAGSREEEASSSLTKGGQRRPADSLNQRSASLWEMRKRKRGSTFLQNPPSHSYNPDGIGEMVRQQGQR
ncbi:hypothetical protein XENOCAPTIV_009681, partial [Xenoophorus captivus]